MGERRNNVGRRERKGGVRKREEEIRQVGRGWRTTGAARGTTTADKAAMDDTEHHRAREEQDGESPRPALISMAKRT
jgi:hypothetical protein